MPNEEMRTAQAELAAATARSTDLYDFAPVGYFILDRGGQITQANRAAASLLGLERARLVGQNFAEFVAEADRPGFSEYLRQVVAGETPPPCVVELETSHEPRTVQFNSALSADGLECRVVAADITACQRAAAAAQASGGRYRTLFEHSTDAIVFLEASGPEAGRILDANERTASMHGHTLDHIKTLNIRDLDVPTSAALVAERLRQLRETGQLHFEMEHRRKDGSVFPVEVSARLIKIGGQQLVLAVNRDITARRAAEAALRESEVRWRFALEGASDGVWDWDVPASTVFFSKRWKEMLGFTEAEIGTGLEEWSSRVHPEDLPLVMADLQPHLDGLTASYANEHRVRCRDGSYKWILDRGLVITRDPAGQPLRAVGTHTDITARKQAQEALRRSTQLLDASQSIAQTGGWEMDLATQQLFWTAETYRLHDTTPEEYHPTVDAGIGFYLPESRPILSAALQAAMERGAGFDLALEFQTAKGRRINVRATCAVTLHEGRPVKLTGIFQDITERTTAEAAQARLAAIVASSDDAIISKDLDGIITTWNHGAEKLFGYAAAEIVGQPVTRLFPPEQQAEALEIREQIKAGKTVLHLETVRLTKDGRHIKVSATISPIQGRRGQIIGSSKIVRDITAREAVALEMAKALKELTDVKAAFDEHALVAITDAQGKINFVNDKFCAISQYARAELLGQDHRIINSGHHPKEFIRELWTTIGRGRVWKGELKNRAKDGSFYWVDTTIVPFLKPDGKPYQYVAIRSDITARKQAEAEVLQINTGLERRVSDRTAELEAANQELEAFSYSVSHDLRAPLRHLTGFAELLQKNDHAKLDDRARRHLTFISESAVRMGQLIDDLLAFSRSGRMEFRKVPVNLDALVEEVIQSMHPGTQGRRIVWQIAPLPAVHADANLLRAVLTNLLANALKFTQPRAEAAIQMGCTENEHEHVFFIRDNGVGFDMQYVEKLFGVFQRLHATDEFEGTGIGLANVRRIVSRHGGRTWAESVLNEGATFYFSLPKPAETKPAETKPI